MVPRDALDGGVILFYGEGGGRRGVYQIVGGGLTAVIDNQTVLPGNVSPVAIFDASDVSFANDALDVALVLTESNGGVWKRISGQWSRIIANNAPIPNGSGIFFHFYSPAIRCGKVVFLGGRDNPFALPLQSGIYTDAFGGVVPVVDLSTPFAYPDPHDFVVAEGGRWFDGTDIAFAVESRTGEDWRALYRATPVPEPGPMLAGITDLLVAASRRVRRRRAGLPATRTTRIAAAAR